MHKLNIHNLIPFYLITPYPIPPLDPFLKRVYPIPHFLNSFPNLTQISAFMDGPDNFWIGFWNMAWQVAPFRRFHHRKP